MNVKTGWAVAVALCLGAGVSNAAWAAEDNAPKEREATNAAQSWLALVDGGKYVESWSAASDHFRKSVAKDAWAQQLEASRKPFGEAGKRALKSRTYTRSLPGAPDGEYVVLEYETSFSAKKEANERVVVARDGGAWKVAGYFIH